MGRIAAWALMILWVGSAFSAESPAELFSVSYAIDAPRPGIPSAEGAAARTGRVSRLEELLLRPEVAFPAPSVPRQVAMEAPARFDNLWERIRAGFAMRDLDLPLVDRWQAWYLGRPLVLRGIVERSRRYLFHVVEELTRRGLPTELAFLPMVESGYNPVALSSAQASGLWQFIPSTGRIYNLHQSPEYDARRDIVASTSAALDYLQALHEQFGDWHLALAAYNWGENAVAAAIARNAAKGLARDYASLTMPDETRNYVPKLQALKNLFAYPAAFKLELEPIANLPYFTTVADGHGLDVAVAAKLAGVSLDEFASLNPAFTNSVVATGTNRGLVIPVEQLGIFRANLETYKSMNASPKRAKKKPASAR